jgi:hypothetical protein
MDKFQKKEKELWLSKEETAHPSVREKQKQEKQTSSTSF